MSISPTACEADRPCGRGSTLVQEAGPGHDTAGLRFGVSRGARGEKLGRILFGDLPHVSHDAGLSSSAALRHLSDLTYLIDTPLKARFRLISYSHFSTQGVTAPTLLIVLSAGLDVPDGSCNLEGLPRISCCHLRGVRLEGILVALYDHMKMDMLYKSRA